MLALELAPEQFALWRQHPVSRLVFDAFMRDYADRFLRIVTDAWLSGGLNLSDENVKRGQIMAMRELIELRLHNIRNFYGIEHPQEQAGRRP